MRRALEHEAVGLVARLRRGRGPDRPVDIDGGLAVVGLQAPLTFLNAENFAADVLNVLKASPQPGLLVLEASGILELDFTAAQTLLDLIGECRKQEVTLAVARLESTRAQEAFTRFGIYDTLPKDRLFRSVDEAIKALGNKP